MRTARAKSKEKERRPAARTLRRPAPRAEVPERPKDDRPGSGGNWLVLFHQIPPRPHYLRVKVGRQLRRLGALALKNTVYVLPDAPRHREALAGAAREILERGGDAVVCEARFVAGLSSAALADRFRAACDVEYADVADEARRLGGTLRGPGPSSEARRRAAGRRLERLRRRFEEIASRDPFGAAGREVASGLISLVEDRIQGVEDAAEPDPRLVAPPRGAVWVTRAGIMVDRIASAWLIQRHIDRSARFKFVSGGGYRPAPGELRFDMAGAEYTHQGPRCTFEVLLERFRLRDSALSAIAEIVHDLDLRDDRFARPEASGVGRMIVGIALNAAADGERLKQGLTLFDGLYESFRRPAHGWAGRQDAVGPGGTPGRPQGRDPS